MSSSILGNKAIEHYLSLGEIVIEPFNEKNLGTNSYDVSIGEWYFTEQLLNEWESPIYNIYSEKNVKRIWGEPQKAKPCAFYKEKGIYLENIRDDELIIMLPPNQTILNHTQEFIGGRTHISTMMKSRSSLGRNFIECCKCSGMGDVGYFNRYTMEITNNSNQYSIPLVVGRRCAQILFIDVGEINSQEKNYNKTGKYQTYQSIEELKEKWTPYDMLPKMYLDFENFQKN